MAKKKPPDCGIEARDEIFSKVAREIDNKCRRKYKKSSTKVIADQLLNLMFAKAPKIAKVKGKVLKKMLAKGYRVVAETGGMDKETIIAWNEDNGGLQLGAIKEINELRGEKPSQKVALGIEGLTVELVNYGEPIKTEPPKAIIKKKRGRPKKKK